MKVFYFCAHTIAWHVCGLMGKGKLCPKHSLLQWSVLVCATLSVCLCSSAQSVTGDSLSIEKDRPRIRQMMVPAALITIGSFGVSNGWFCSLKQEVKDGFYDLKGDKRFKVDDYLQYLPVAANVGLEFVGAKPRHSFRERIAATATAYAAMGLMVNVTKLAVDEKRPDSGALNSFPSGHTATAFMGAELVREEYGNAYGIGAYAFASGIAVLRLYNDRHWLNDVIAGAGVGIFSARIGYWLLPWEQRIFGWDKTSRSISLLPVYNPAEHSASISLLTVF